MPAFVTVHTVLKHNFQVEGSVVGGVWISFGTTCFDFLHLKSGLLKGIRN